MTSHLILVGPMGSGKSSVGAELAKLLGLPLVDLDATVSRAHGDIPTLFRTRGEEAFRELESHALLEALGAAPSVIATGGGIVLREGNRRALKEHTVVSLHLSADTAAVRLAGDSSRPLLASEDPAAAWAAIAHTRAPLYAEVATLDVATDEDAPSVVAQNIATALASVTQGETMSIAESSTIHVDTPEGPGYDVVVGHGLLGRLAPMLGDRAQKVLVIHPRALRATGDTVREQLQADGYEAMTAEIPDAEEGKRVEVAAFCWQIMGQSDFTRTDAIVAVGGGSVTDLAGFVAATWLRGVRWVGMPTTFLGMVDAAVGGKTGINTAEGKNLVGAFHPPVGVLADLDTLKTLPRNELVAGMAEAVKCGFIVDPAILDLFEGNLEAATDPESPVFREIVERTIAVKAEVVGEDLKETGRREFLNYGHTLAHAIEHAERYQWRHGAAVSVGLVFAAELGRLLGRLDDATADRTRAVLESLGLPTSYRADRWKTLLATMRRDKKSRGDHLRFIVLDGLGRPAVLEAPEEHLLFTAYQEVAA